MAFDGLNQFIEKLGEENELARITRYVSPILEITEIADRVVKKGGKALLFENNGTSFPLLINMFGSENRMCMSLGRNDLDEAGREIMSLFSRVNQSGSGFADKLRMLPSLFELASLAPRKIRRRGKCQEVVMEDPNLEILPVMQCWPFDGGRFITLPVVHTFNPDNGETNAGMYRMQILDSKTTGMHWHRHKTGANHFELWKKRGELMPVAVTLGGDPVYTYSATAPLPEGIDEYLLAGFLRKKRVKMVKCITQDIFVPEDADIVIEGYVDPSEELVWEGPFGDHTGFYSLADWYPKFHVTCITHRKKAVYPSTIVGVPPQEDAMIGKATERLFLYPIKLTLQPDITDIHMPAPGVAHNLVLVSINKKYPGQGLKVINSLFGAGQMMFSKYIVVMDSDINLTDYNQVVAAIMQNVSMKGDLMITRGPLDVLDHSSDTFSFGGKMGIDATGKLAEEKPADYLANNRHINNDNIRLIAGSVEGILNHRFQPGSSGGLLFLSMESEARLTAGTIGELAAAGVTWLFVFDKGVDLSDNFLMAWQVLSNSDPVRDIKIESEIILFDSRAKTGSEFPRRWPNVVISSDETIEKTDSMWGELQLGPLLESPSLLVKPLIFRGGAEAERIRERL